MYIRQTDVNFPNELIRANGELTVTYLGGLDIFDKLGANKKLTLQVASSGMYLLYPVTQTMFSKTHGDRIFIPLDDIVYMNVMHDPQIIEQYQRKSMVKRTMVGSMIGGRRGARLGALSSITPKKTVTQNSVYQYVLRITVQGNETDIALSIESTNTNEIRQIDRFNTVAVQPLLQNKLVFDNNFSNLQAQPTSSTTTDSYDELIKLKQLFDQGIINEAEFEAKKKQILGL